MENKTGKYLKYAIGEIVLVVIGILIALSINNWNDNRKNKLAESDYYCRILEDFQINEKLVNESLEGITNRIKISKKIILDLNKTPNNKSEILNDFLHALRQNVFVPSNITFEELTSSGNIKFITDIQLKNRLIEFNTFLENTLDLLKENRNELNKRMINFESATEFGMQEFDYLENELGKEIVQLLPSIEWTNNKNDKTFLKFQDNLVFLVAMYVRKKQHLYNLKVEMEEPIRLLKNKKCE
ncbi:DUF6090 family protein [Xanthomarina sp. GH4-25]|uniref:DUF6090 family protein n=1 Tax=Xanthomarina sp. GH4-25 TaxID=3349335 RepID=UPI00387805A9